MSFPDLKRLELCVAERLFGGEALVELQKANPCIVEVRIAIDRYCVPRQPGKEQRMISSDALVDFVRGATRLRRLGLVSFSQRVISHVINTATEERHPSLRYVNGERLLSSKSVDTSMR
jgi:hypothetical protein